MTYVALVLCATLLALVVVLVVRERDHEAVLADLLQSQRDERETLQNKLAYPGVYQPTPSQVKPASTEPQASDISELARVGTLIMGDPDGFDN